ncbi:MAG: M1 family peptidase [Planctomycetota bacterium]|nr:MAG: M1 family peptidase [Planctomycetota bacterium]
MLSNPARWPILGTCLILAGLGFSACGGESKSSSSSAEVDSNFLRDTGGELVPLQAAYDVQHYRLALEVFPEEQRLEGSLTVEAEILQPLAQLLLDLDPLLQVREVRDDQDRSLPFQHQQGRITIDLEQKLQAGAVARATVFYGGKPRVAPRPPWEGGWIWAQTASGEPWLATACQMEGADLWWPCKDHPSDKAESMDLHITVPEPLICAANGRLLEVQQHAESKRTFHWQVSTPIPNYGVALNIGPYQKLEHEYQSLGGESLPIQFWFLPENEAKARAIVGQFADHMRFFEQNFGPYPFRADKYGVVETPHLGMEHQTIIAYGNQYQNNKWNYDWLHHHELAHEWFANLVTAPDWNDFWIHEGFGSYAQKLYIEQMHGLEAYFEALRDVRGNIRNARPLAPRKPRTSGQMYFVNRNDDEGGKATDSDIYYKGEWVIHSLRWLLGREMVLKSMRRLCYPDPEMESQTDGRQCHFATSGDYQALVEELSGQDLDWFFELYLRQPELPLLQATRREGSLELRWQTPNDMPFPMPIPLRVNGDDLRISLKNGVAKIPLPLDAKVELDPNDWVLHQGNRR